MRVHVPARMEAYDRGMRYLDGLKLNSQLRFRMMGMKRTTTGVLLIKAEATATMHKINSVANLTLPLEWSMILLAIIPTTPVRIKPRLMINMAPTVMTAGLANPPTASEGVSTPVAISAAMMPTAVRSTEIISVIRRTRVTTKMRDTIQMVIENDTCLRY
jgi:hypothetical protein